jgi:hypothetical protein
MLHACLCTICFVFCYTSWRFYAFSETNLLTRCHSASSLFSDVFVFQKSYTRNILGIRRNKSRSSYFFPTRDGVQSRDGGEPRGDHTIGWRGLPLAHANRWWGHLAHLLTSPFRLYILLDEKTLSPDQFSRKHTASHHRHRREIGRVQKLFRHPAGEGNHHQRPSSSLCLPLEWCVSSLPWTTCP